MEYAEVNHLLKRPLQSGERYDRYFKDSRCTPTFLGKSDTAFTVRQMKKWAIKNAPQTRTLAQKEFSGKGLQRTVEAIYGFLYGHVQYEMDGRVQNLKSPACTWATRKKGTDCKSYSIFASTLLQNLGIKHYFRRVKQPGMQPDKWTHVYVVVPKDQKTLRAERTEEYLIIDATVHDNKEVPFTQKHDTLMSKVSLPHIGLQSPLHYGLAGCTCTPKPQRQTTATTPVATRSVAPTTTTRPRMTTTVRTPERTTEAPVRSTRPVSTAPSRSGRRITATPRDEAAIRMPGLRSSGKIFDTRNIGTTPGFGGGSTQGNNTGKFDYASAATNTLSNAFAAAKQQKAATSQGNRQQRLAAIGKTGATSATIKSIGAAAAPYTYGITAILALVPSEWYEKVLGQWFKDGFKCIGASWTPTKAKTTLEIESEFIKSEAASVFFAMQDGTVEQIEAAINKWMEFFYSVRSTERHWLSSSAKDCTRDGLILLIKGLDEGKKSVVSEFKKAIAGYGHNLVSAGTKTVKYPPEAHTGRHALTQKVEQFRIQLNPNVVKQAQSAQSAQNNIPQQNLNEFKSGQKQAGFGTTGILALLAVAGGAYMYKSS